MWLRQHLNGELYQSKNVFIANQHKIARLFTWEGLYADRNGADGYKLGKY